MRTTRPPAGSFATDVSLSYTPMACPNLHDDLESVVMPSGTKYYVFDKMYDIHLSSREVWCQIKVEAENETD